MVSTDEETTIMPRITSTLSTDQQKVTGEALQGALVDLIDLSLMAKQAHWNVVGPNFRSVHLQLDEVVTAARLHMDLIAERASAIGVNPDGRASTVASSSGVPQVGEGWLQDTDVVKSVTEALAAVAKRMRERIDVTEKPDPVTQDLLIEAAAELEKQHWMFQAAMAK
jgi:starvation-inducible DNA-binding protein